MSELTRSDKTLWGGLIDTVLSPRTETAKIRREAKRANKAVKPEGYRAADQCFSRLVRIGEVLQGGDTAGRELLRGYARECADVLGWGEKAPAPPAVARDEDAVRFRKDVDG